jgi:hypothetical protein
MRSILAFSLIFFIQSGFSQQQQFSNTISNSNFNNIGNVNSANNNSNNIIQIRSTPIQRQQLSPRSSERTRSINNVSQLSRINTNKLPVTAQVRRTQPRPRRINTLPNTINLPKNINSIETNIAKESMPINQMVNFENNNDLSIQNDSNPFSQELNSGEQTFKTIETPQMNINLDLSLNLKGNSVIRSRSTSSSTSSSHAKNRAFSMKLAKFKRNFFGKLSSHKKSKHRLDVCFNWKK